ncbi:MAG: hypothetical protein LBI82_09060 [Dysgonamonadaceae bacterium]|nr:hypothetical protein [Dysgonamonadaceae bacterium]
MTTILINDIKDHPPVVRTVDEFDNMPLPLSEEEFVTLEEFKVHMEELAYKRLGLNLTL